MRTPVKSLFDFRFREEKPEEPPPSSGFAFKLVFFVFVLLMPAGIALTGIPHGTPRGSAPPGSFPDYPLVTRVLGGMLLFLIGWLLSVVLAVVGIVRAVVVRRGLPWWATIALVCMVAGVIVMMYFGSQ
jgi:hypothetical protein